MGEVSDDRRSDICNTKEQRIAVLDCGDWSVAPSLIITASGLATMKHNAHETRDNRRNDAPYTPGRVMRASLAWLGCRRTPEKGRTNRIQSPSGACLVHCQPARSQRESCRNSVRKTDPSPRSLHDDTNAKQNAISPTIILTHYHSHPLSFLLVRPVSPLSHLSILSPLSSFFSSPSLVIPVLLSLLFSPLSQTASPPYSTLCSPSCPPIVMFGTPS